MINVVFVFTLRFVKPFLVCQYVESTKSHPQNIVVLFFSSLEKNIWMVVYISLA